jgi:hypothetical protein
MRTILSVHAEVRISRDGRAARAHVVRILDEVVADFLNGELVRARGGAPEPEADVPLLDRGPRRRGAREARRLTVEIGNHVFIVGAPYEVGILLRLMQSEASRALRNLT